MTEPENPFGRFTKESAIDLILQVFQGQNQPTPAEVDQQVADLLRTRVFGHLQEHTNTIATEVLRRTSVVIGAATTLDDNRDHVEWLQQAGRSDWRFWPRLDDYLRRIDDLSPSVLNELDRSTDQALERLESPARAGRWDRRGLVVGHVQSGKTTHYTALASKALDAGYQIVVILAGIHNSLRSQTHERIDRHLIGRHSAALLDAVRQHGGQALTIGAFGVGEEDRRLGRPDLPLALLTCTTSADDGDFRTVIANQIGFQVSHASRLVLVVKKNATILRSLINWLRLQNAVGGASDTRTIPNPVLVIDDEADHASMNTAKDIDADPTTINQLIRALLISFDRVGFVGYTATPFANIFASHEDTGGRFGPDLFPKSFILNLRAPSDYVGPGLVFGHQGDESAGIPEQEALPMYVGVNDSGRWIPDKHKRDQTPGPLPASLREAIRLFVLVCAARAARGHPNTHNSMLVHATRFIDVQGKIERQITEELDGLRNITGLAAKADLADLEVQLKSVWDRRIVEEHQSFRAILGDRCPSLPPWSAVWGNLQTVLKRMQIMRINGQSTDALAYTKTPDGLYVIAIGGDKLSRGLTLEGLSVSYFLRTSNMFDTLMQMGRWFGYRPGYIDLCRVYTTSTLYGTFREIALAMDDLRADLDYMAGTGKTPTQFGLRVRTPSDGLLITAANKIRTGEDVRVRFAGSLVQALEIASTGTRANDNRSACRAMLERLGSPDHLVRGRESPHFMWRGVHVDTVLDFLGSYEAYSTPSFYHHCEALRRYIREQVTKGELTEWTITVVGKMDPRLRLEFGSQRYPLVFRARKKGSSDRFETQAVVGSGDESLDLDADEFARALAKAPLTDKGAPRAYPARQALREMRPATRGFLMLYLLEPESADPKMFIPSIAISFPDSTTAQPLTYTVNKVWREQRGLLGDLDDDAVS